MSENKNYKIIKVTPSEILFDLHPASNSGLTRRIYLNSRVTQQALPEDWAIGVFQDQAIYNMYKQGLFTFDDNEGIVKAAFEAGAYFDDKLDFVPATPTRSNDVLMILKSGNRANIMKAIETYGKDAVREVAMQHVNGLTQGVIVMLENILNTQLVLEED